MKNRRCWPSPAFYDSPAGSGPASADATRFSHQTKLASSAAIGAKQASVRPSLQPQLSPRSIQPHQAAEKDRLKQRAAEDVKSRSAPVFPIPGARKSATRHDNGAKRNINEEDLRQPEHSTSRPTTGEADNRRRPHDPAHDAQRLGPVPQRKRLEAKARAIGDRALAPTACSARH